MNFKKLNIAILIFLLPVFCAAQDFDFTLTGTINPSHNGELASVAYFNGQKTVQDSAVVSGGKLLIKGRTNCPSVGYLRVGKVQPANSVDFYISPGTTNFQVQDSLKFAVIKGGQAQEDYRLLMTTIHPIMMEKIAIGYEFRALPLPERKTKKGLAMAQKATEIGKHLSDAIYAFIAQHPDSYVSLDFLQKVSGSTINYAVAMPLFDHLSKKIQDTKQGQDFKAKLLLSKSMMVGTKAKTFSSTTPEGKKLSLEEIVAAGKFTLIDFWASWCGPCRKENPNVVSAYSTFHEKGFNIISVSLDSKEADWKAAILKDGMPWYHVSSLMGFQEPVAVLYGISAIPQNVIVNHQGTIVATNLRGDALAAKLAQLMHE